MEAKVDGGGDLATEGAEDGVATRTGGEGALGNEENQVGSESFFAPKL